MPTRLSLESYGPADASDTWLQGDRRSGWRTLKVEVDEPFGARPILELREDREVNVSKLVWWAWLVLPDVEL